MQLETIIEDDNFFDLIRMVILVLFPVIMCLRLADKNKPGMDRIWYYARLTHARIHNFASEFNNCWEDDFFKNNIADELEDNVEKDLDEGVEIVEPIEEEVTGEDAKKAALKFLSDSFGDQVTALWDKREAQIKSDYAIVGWLLSVEPNVYSDAKSYTQTDVDILRKVASKLIQHMDNAEDYINKCME